MKNNSNTQDEKFVTFQFYTINNMNDPGNLDIKAGECVDIVNFDCDNNGNITTRDAKVVDLVQQPLIEYMGGRRYWAEGNTVYCTKALSEDEDQRYSTVISTDDMITMICRVDGGMYIGTSGELHYLHGDDPQEGGFKDNWTLPYGVILGTGLKVKGEIAPSSGMKGNCCIFASHRGVIVGGPGGNIVNLSFGKVSYEYGIVGKACLREEKGLVHYLFTTSKSNAAQNMAPPVNLEQA